MGVKIYKGKKKYRLIFPNSLARQYSFIELKRGAEIVFQGNYPEEGAQQIELFDMKDHLPRTFDLVAGADKKGQWFQVLVNQISAIHPEAIVILEAA